MNRTAFYNHVRVPLFGGRLTPEQVGGTEALLDAMENYPVTDFRQAAYILAGVFHEVGKRMVPVREGFASTDAGARAAVARLHERGMISRNYAVPVNGISYYGRGRIQNTHLENYQKLEKRFDKPFVSDPDLLLDSEVDAAVTVAGHMEGIWTGKKLSDYINGDKVDFAGARRIVNGTDKASLIAGYAQKFEAALLSAGYGKPRPATAPEKEEQSVTHTPSAPPVETVSPAPTPVEQASKAVGAAKGAAAGSGVAAAVVTLSLAFGWLPEAMNTAEVGAAFGIVLTSMCATVQAAISAYRAPPNAG